MIRKTKTHMHSHVKSSERNWPVWKSFGTKRERPRTSKRRKYWESSQLPILDSNELVLNSGFKHYSENVLPIKGKHPPVQNQPKKRNGILHPPTPALPSSLNLVWSIIVITSSRPIKDHRSELCPAGCHRWTFAYVSVKSISTSLPCSPETTLGPRSIGRILADGEMTHTCTLPLHECVWWMCVCVCTCEHRYLWSVGLMMLAVKQGGEERKKKCWERGKWRDI